MSNEQLASSKIKVLLVDDDQDSFILTRHQLSKIPAGNFTMEWASSYEAGLAEIQKGEHDVYLLDYRLGAKTGLDLLTEALASGCKAPIIMLTSENPQVDAEAMKLGAADFLSKDKLDSALLERSIRYSVKHFNTLRALRESEARLASFMHYVPCAVFIKNLQGRYVFVNEMCEKVFRRRLEEWVGRTDEDLWSKNLANKFKLIDAQIIKEKKAIETTESVSSHDDGAQHWLTTRFPIMNEQGEPIMIGGAAINITESKRLERELQTVSEREQRRIGQDLHDGLGQYLTGIACMVKVLGAKLAEKKLPEANDAQRITSMVNETIQQARDLARGLCPVELETNGLQAALHELAQRVTKLFSVECDFKAPGVVQMYDNAAAVHLYRIAQEAINNAIKHGQATKIDLGLTAANGQIILTVKDNGIGVTLNGHKPQGMGLRVMNYRAGMIGATVQLDSLAEGGTVVKCTVQNKRPEPVAKKPSKAAGNKPSPKAQKAELAAT